ADVFRPEGVAEGEEFLVGQRLDRDGVEGAPPEADGAELKGKRNERFPRSGGGVEDHVVPGEEFEDRLFLVVVGRRAGFLKIGQESTEDLIGGGWVGNIGGREGGHLGVSVVGDFGNSKAKKGGADTSP